MSLASFAHCSKCESDEYERKQAEIRNRPNFKNVNVLIHRIKGETQKETEIDDNFLYFNSGELNSKHEDTRALLELLSVKFSTHSSLDAKSNLRKGRKRDGRGNRSWVKSKKLLPPRGAGIKLKSTYRVKKWNTQPESHEFKENSTAIHNKHQDPSFQRTFLTTIDDVEEPQKSLTPKHTRKNIVHSVPIQRVKFNPSFLRPQAIPFTLRPTSTERAISFQRRNRRIEVARHKRNSLHLTQMRKIRENIDKKEQKRIDHAEMKERESRQQKILCTMVLASTINDWLSATPDIIEEFRIQKALNTAAILIQNLWKKELFVRKALESRTINKKLKKISWKLRIWARCTRRRLNAQILRCFFQEFMSQIMKYVFYIFRTRVRKAQDLMRAFIDCKRARISTLRRSWADLEKQTTENFEVKNGRRRRKNALMEIMNKKINKASGKGNEHNLNCFTSVAMEVTRRPCLPNIRDDGEPVDAALSFSICKFHLEDCRRQHLRQVTETKMAKMDIPVLTHEHAKLLLAGKEFNFELEISKHYPPFTIYHTKKEELRLAIEGAKRNENLTKMNIETRTSSQKITSEANRYAAGIPKAPQASNIVDTDKELDTCLCLAKEYGTTIENIKELKEMFSLIDLDSSGTVNEKKFDKLFELIGIVKDENENNHFLTVALLEKHLSTCSGVIDFPRFVALVHDPIKENAYTQEMVINAFQYFARDMPSGKISRQQLLSILESFTGKWERRKSERVLKATCLDNGDGNFEYNKFVERCYSILFGNHSHR